MIIHSGGKASAFKHGGKASEVDSYDADGVSLYHVKGTDAIDTHAVQVAERAASLNSGDCFVLLTPKMMLEWRGAGANEAEVACGRWWCRHLATVCLSRTDRRASCHHHSRGGVTHHH